MRFDSILAVLSRINPIRWCTQLLRTRSQNHPQLANSALCGGGLSFQLVPLANVFASADTVFQWSAVNDDPSFMLQGIEKHFSPGWYQIELAMRSDSVYTREKIYFDWGQGFSEDNVAFLNPISATKKQILLHAAVQPRSVRFDPMESLADFSIDTLSFTPISESIAELEMFRFVQSRHAANQHSPVEDLKALLQQEAEAANTTLGAILYKRYQGYCAHTPANSATQYLLWITKYEEPEFRSLSKKKRGEIDFASQPLVSVVMPTYNTPEKYLRLAIDSVLKQTYTNWQLCIADDNSTSPAIREILNEYSQLDDRIRLIFRAENGHISAASNTALSLAEGDYIAFLDHDDELAEHALYYLVRYINEYPTAQVFYSDEDKIDLDGVRSEPHFKPDWNPDLFFSQNYVAHLCAYRRDLLGKIGGFRTGVEGSQDHDLLLRCLPYLDGREIVHIPRVLYHWRKSENSTALSSAAKSYSTEAGIKALRDFLLERRMGVTVEPGAAPNTYRLHYPSPKPDPLVSLLMPTRDNRDLLEVSVWSVLAKSEYKNFELIILDNQSRAPDALAFLAQIAHEDRRVRVLRYDHPFNFSSINNFGVSQARGAIVGLVNNDIEVITPGWLTEMVSHAVRPEIGCVGAKLLYKDGTLQHAGVIVGLSGAAGHSHRHYEQGAPGYFSRLRCVQNYSAVTAACMLVRKSVFQEVGGFDDENLKIAFNDVDFCLKVREAGYRNLWTPYAELYHLESKSRGIEDTPEKQERFRQEVLYLQNKWKTHQVFDPCYNPNLTRTREDFSITD